MTMDTIFAALACYLLAFSFAVARTQRENLTITPTITTPGLNLTHTTVISSNSAVPVISSSTENTTPFTSTTKSLTKSTAATTESTGHLQTSQSTAALTPLTNTTSVTATQAPPSTPTFTALTTPAMQTTVGFISTPDTTAITTANSSHTVNTTLGPMDRTTQGLGLNISEKIMTIFFSVVLGVFALALVVFMFHRCKHKIQYFHQPLNNTDGTDAFVADDDTLVISGGLYDGHPIYDNVPTAPAEQSQFRLQFLH